MPKPEQVQLRSPMPGVPGPISSAQVQLEVLGQFAVAVVELQRGTEKAGAIDAMEGKKWFIQQGIWVVTKNHKEDAKDDEFPATTYKQNSFSTLWD